MAAHTIEERKQAIYDTLHSIHADGKPGDYDTNRTLNLITVTDAVATLCWNIESATTLPKPLLRTSLTAQDIKEEATKITSFCLAELDNMRDGANRAGATIISDYAELNLHRRAPIGSLDMGINPAIRIALLIEALGNAAPYWPLLPSLKKVDLLDREETIAMLAYHAVCALIATNRHLIVG
jgi:hypothetical protein